jgi:hypothetical protein
MNSKSILITLAVALVVGAGSFFGGMKYQQFRRPSQFGQFRQLGQSGRGNANLPAGRQGFRPVAGEIISADDKSITVKMTDGSNKIVIFSDSTEINKAGTADKSELKVGETVSVFGTSNSDGSITAQNIQLNPAFRRLDLPSPTPAN